MKKLFFGVVLTLGSFMFINAQVQSQDDPQNVVTSTQEETTAIEVQKDTTVVEVQKDVTATEVQEATTTTTTTDEQQQSGATTEKDGNVAE